MKNKTYKIIAQITDFRSFVIRAKDRDAAIEEVAEKLKSDGVEATAFRVEGMDY